MQPRGDDHVQALGHLLEPPALDQHPTELFGVERVAADASEQSLLLGCNHCLLQQLGNKVSRVALGQGRERDREDIRLAACPVGPTLEQLRPRRRDDEERHPVDAVDELVDEVEERVVGPVQVLEGEYERTLVRERLEEVPPCGECLAPALGGDGSSPPSPRRAPK